MQCENIINVGLVNDQVNDPSSFEVIADKIKAYLLSQKTKKIKKVKGIDIEKLFQVSKSDTEEVLTTNIIAKVRVPPLRFLNPFRYFRTEMDLYLTLDQIGSSGLGDIPSSPFNYANLVNYVTYNRSTQFVEISLLGFHSDITPLEYVVQVFESAGDQEKKMAAENLQQLGWLHKQPLTNFEIKQQFNEILEGYENVMQMLFIVNLNADGSSKLQKMLINKKLLHLMGVTKNMYTDFILREKQIPEPTQKDNYLQFWNQIMEANYKERNDPITFITTYEGINVSIRVKVKNHFLLTKENQLQIITQWLIYLGNEYNEQLFEKNRRKLIEKQYYENLKINSFELEKKFKQQLYLEKNELQGKICGYKIKK